MASIHWNTEDVTRELLSKCADARRRANYAHDMAIANLNLSRKWPEFRAAFRGWHHLEHVWDERARQLAEGIPLVM